MIKEIKGTVKVTDQGVNKDVSYTYYSQDQYLNTEILKLIKNIDYTTTYNIEQKMGIYAIDNYVTKWISDNLDKLERLYSSEQVPTMGHFKYENGSYVSELVNSFGNPDLNSKAIYNNGEFYPKTVNGTTEDVYGVNKSEERKERWTTTYIQGHSILRRPLFKNPILKTRPKKDVQSGGLVGQYANFDRYVQGLQDSDPTTVTVINSLGDFIPEIYETYYVFKDLKIRNSATDPDNAQNKGYEMTVKKNDDYNYQVTIPDDNSVDHTYYLPFILARVINKVLNDATSGEVQFMYRNVFNSEYIKFLEQDVINIYQTKLGCNTTLTLTDQLVTYLPKFGDDYHRMEILIKPVFDDYLSVIEYETVKKALSCTRTFDILFCSYLEDEPSFTNYTPTEIFSTNKRFIDQVNDEYVHSKIIYHPEFNAENKYTYELYYATATTEGAVSSIEVPLLDIEDLTVETFKPPTLPDIITSNNKEELKTEYETWLGNINTLVKERDGKVYKQIEDVIKKGKITIEGKDYDYYAQDQYLNTEINKLLKNIDQQVIEYDDNDFNRVDLTKPMGVCLIDGYATYWILSNIDKLEKIYDIAQTDPNDPRSIPSGGHVIKDGASYVSRLTQHFGPNQKAKDIYGQVPGSDPSSIYVYYPTKIGAAGPNGNKDRWDVGEFYIQETNGNQQRMM